MEISRHTLITSLILFTLLAVISGILTRNASWKTFKFSGSIIILCMLRLLFPFEFFETKIIRMQGFYALIDFSLRQKLCYVLFGY